MSPCGLVLVFETRERERGGARAPERAHVGSFWWSRWGGVPKHQNEPVWARSGVRDEGERERRCASTRTSPCGHVLVVEMGRGAQTSERPRVGSFWCSRRGRGRGEVREHQNVPMRACSGVRDREGRGEVREHFLMFET